MIIALILKAAIAAFTTEDGLALGILAALSVSTVDAYLWAAPSFVVHGFLIGGSLVGLLWAVLRSLREERPWDF